MPEHHSDDEYLTAIREGNQTTSEIADAVGVARQSAYERLHTLRENGKVRKEKIGNSLRWETTEAE
ncbi:winged helix-turn-helix domain-containing protein [Halobellus rubicundus]|uniref:Winged helix-turn-helix domain-containing protein n=1 Tax=Halobellus rubicundus TaxID=2996466 RepID=A0ABD5MFN8_9EURY